MKRNNMGFEHKELNNVNINFNSNIDDIVHHAEVGNTNNGIKEAVNSTKFGLIFDENTVYEYDEECLDCFKNKK